MPITITNDQVLDKLTRAVETGDVMNAAIFASGLNLEESSSVELEYLQYAATGSANGDHLLDILLNIGLDIDYHKSGRTCLLKIAHTPRVHELKLLLDRGADPNYYYSECGTALHIASSYGLIQNVDMLINYGAKDMSNSNGMYAYDILLEKVGESARTLLNILMTHRTN